MALAQLGKLGYTADVVANGAEALEALQQRGYDLVLMDCEMPVMDGSELPRIHEEGICLVSVVASTANEMSDDRDRCLREGMNDFLTKPVEIEQLAEVLAKWNPAPERLDAASTTEPAAPELEPVVFDTEALLHRLMGDRQLAGRVVEMFLEYVPSQLDGLRKRLVERDAAGASSQAHALKGSAANVSAGSLRAVALRMERAADAGELDRLDDLLSCAAQEFERLKGAVKQAGWI